ncbi:unnamed protein product [Schistosoma turkestanicum]|nr:unnamed protein product [Schistosoma turkestanicum]
MSSLTSHWKRFISACASSSTGGTSCSSFVSNSNVGGGGGGGGASSGVPSSASQNSFQKSPSEWQCLNETINLLLKTCPVSRSAILDHLAPLYIEYFVTWWHINAGTIGTNRSNLNYESQNLQRAEVVLQSILKTINALIIHKGVTDHFLGTVCSWCLVLIRPVCTVPPTQLLSDLMDLIGSHSSRQQDNKHKSFSISSKTSNNNVNISTSRKTLHKTSNTDNMNMNTNTIGDRNRFNPIKSTTTTNTTTNYRYDKKHKSDPRSLSSLASSTVTPPYHQLILSDSDSCSNSSTTDEENEFADVDNIDHTGDDGMLPTPAAATATTTNTSSMSHETNETNDVKSLSTSSDNRIHSEENESNNNNNTSSCNIRSTSLHSNDQLVGSLKKPDSHSVEDNMIDLDFSAKSAVNQQILGIWIKCPVLIDLLNIVCHCLMGSNIRLSSVQALLASSTVLLPSIWGDTNVLDNTKHCHHHSLAANSTILPHWIMIWLLDQATSGNNLISTGGIQKLNELCHLILTSALHPFKPNTLQCALLPDTLGGYFFNQNNFDFDFWMTVCLTHLLFLGDSVPEFLADWLRNKFEPISTYALSITNESALDHDHKQNPLIQETKLLHLIINLSLITVPIPPQSPSELQQQIPLNNNNIPLPLPTSTTTTTTDLSIDHHHYQQQPWRYPYTPKNFNYGLPPSTTYRPPCVQKDMDCTPMSSHFNMPPIPPRNMNPILSTPGHHLPIPPNNNSNNNMLNSNMSPGQQTNFMPFRLNFTQSFEIPARRPPHAPHQQPPPPAPPTLLQVPPMNITTNRSNLNDSHPMLTGAILSLFNERQSNNNYLLSSSSTGSSSSSSSRQSTSLLWIISLIRRIKCVTLSFIIDQLITLTPLQLFALLRNQHEFTYQSAVGIIQLLVKSILQAPVNSNIERLLIYLINISELDSSQLCSTSSGNVTTPTTTTTTTTSTTTNTTDETTYCSEAKKSKLSSDDQLYQSVLEYHKFLNNFILYCRELLRILCESTIFLTYSSSETSDLLERGGCEVYLCCWRSVKPKTNSDEQLFTSQTSLKSSSSTTTTTKPSTSSSSLAQSTFCPLMLFFPILNEIQSIWIARTSIRPSALSTTTTTSTTGTLTMPSVRSIDTSTSINMMLRPSIFPILSIHSHHLLMNSHRMDTTTNSSSSSSYNHHHHHHNNTSLSLLHPNGTLYIQQLLANKFFPLLWSNLVKSDDELRICVLRNLLWLVHRELALIEKNSSGHPRLLLFALSGQLDEIMKMMMLKCVDIQCFNVLLSLCECLFATFQFPTNHNRCSIYNHVNHSTTTINQSMKCNESSTTNLNYINNNYYYYHHHHQPPAAAAAAAPRSQHVTPQSRHALKTPHHLRCDHHHQLVFSFLTITSAQCIQLANSFVQLTSRLIFMLNVDHSSPASASTSSSLSMMPLFILGRFRNLLNFLFVNIQSTVFRSTIMRLIPKVIMSSRLNPYMDNLLKDNHLPYMDYFNDVDHNHQSGLNISCLPSNFFNLTKNRTNGQITSQQHDSLLLIDNPPKKFGHSIDDDQDGLIRGQLKPRMNNININNNYTNKNIRLLTRRGPGESSLGLGYHSTENRILFCMSNTDELNATDYQLSNWFHWLNLIRFMLMPSKHLYHLCNTMELQYSTIQPFDMSSSSSSSSSPPLKQQHDQFIHLSNNHQLMIGLEDIVLIQGGLHIPQTSITSLPYPTLNLVLPPSGVGLERVLNILYAFCPEIKQLMSNNNGNNKLSTALSTTYNNNSSSMSMSSSSKFSVDCQNQCIHFSSQGILELSMMMNKLNLNTYGLPPLLHPLPVYASYFTEASVLNFLDPISLLSTPKILLGLLMGLEAVWASPLAPRISIPMAINYLTQMDNGAYVEQSFPVFGAMDVCKVHARKITVDYAYRRLDIHSSIFKLTRKLLFYLMEICYVQDCLEKRNQQQHQQGKAEEEDDDEAINTKKKLSIPCNKSIEESLKSTEHSSSTSSSSSTCTPASLDYYAAPLDRLLHCLTPRELAILLSDIRRNLRLRIAFYHMKQCKSLLDHLFNENHDDNDELQQQQQQHRLLPLSMMTIIMLNPIPPAPAFITPGLLIALLQAHLMEQGIAECLGALIRSMEVLIPCSVTMATAPSTGSSRNQQQLTTADRFKRQSNRMKMDDDGDGDADVRMEADDRDTIVEEINMNGEEYVIVN